MWTDQSRSLSSTVDASPSRASNLTCSKIWIGWTTSSLTPFVRAQKRTGGVRYPCLIANYLANRSILGN